MARKNKSSKDFHEHNIAIPATTTTSQSNQLQDYLKDAPSLQKRISFAELMFQQRQQLAVPNMPQYQSDSELEQKQNLEKNKSNLYLIKSYSFNDKTNAAKRPQNLNVKKQLEDFNKYHKLMFEESTSVLNNGSKLQVSYNNKQENQMETPVMLENRKIKKIKKSKSCYDSTEDLQEFQEILRKPTVIFENEIPPFKGQRPQSMPAAPNKHKTDAGQAITREDLEVTRFKRDSFMRHSWQSICRTFSSTKKHPNNHVHSIANSSTSASSSASNTLRKSKTKNIATNKDNLKSVQESSSYKAKDDAEKDDNNRLSSLSRPCNIAMTLNDVQTFKTQQHNKQHKQQCKEFSTSNVTSTSLYTADSLAVLKEEDEKDLNPCENIVNGSNSSCSHNKNNNNKYTPSCVIMEKRSTSSVSSLAQLPTTPMAPLQTHTEYQSVQCLNSLDKDYKSPSTTTNTIGVTTSTSSPPQRLKKTLQHQLSIPESLQSTSIGCVTSNENSSARSLKHSETPAAPLQTLHSTGSLRNISPLRHSGSSNSSSTAKHEQSTAAATAAAATTSNGFSSTTPPEKEKKRKEVSSSRVKKFHRHFSQVPKDEKLINYFSCALVSDILLQGYLYITDQHFAFYSNVFGYVTKVVIPTSSVTKITKEKTAKIIPNAVGVATTDERHVFGSFLSREAAFRLMCSVCPPMNIPEIPLKEPAYPISGEYSIEEDSSCSISGNESPAQISDLQNSKTNVNPLPHDTSQVLMMRRSVGSSNLSIAETSAGDKLRHISSDSSSSAKKTTSSSGSTPAATNVLYVNGAGVQLELKPAAITPAHESENRLTPITGCASNNTSASSTRTPSTSSLPTTILTLPSSKFNHIFNILRSVSKKLMLHIKFPTEIHVVYLGVILTLLLTILSIFLLYRILDIEAKTNGYRTATEFNWRTGNDDDIFSEALRLQRQLQLKSTEEAQNILKTNLEQIAKVRRSLETLSMLIHDRRSSFVSANADDSD